MGTTSTQPGGELAGGPPAALLPKDVLCTEQLLLRSPHPPKLQEENEAYRLLARCLVGKTDEMLQALSDQALLLCEGGSSGVSLLEDQPDGTTIFRWVALSGACASYVGGFTPRDFSPCGMCLDENRPILVAHPERCFTYFQQLSLQIIEGLVLPLRSDERVFGTIWVMSHNADHHFDSEDVRGMTGLADFTAAALKMSGLVSEVQRSNADLEQFAYLASHDLQEPLRTVRSFAQLLRRRYKERLDHEADFFLGHIDEGTARMEALIRGLLNYAQVTQTAPTARTVDLNAVFESARQNCQALIDDTGAQLIRSSLPKAHGDAEQLVHVFQNLITNALRYRSPRQPCVEITAREDSRFVEICVKDNGVGIAPEHQTIIFGMFKRHSAKEGGLGIGLALCQRVIERHGGRIWVESVPGKGSTFRFTLPSGSAHAENVI